MSSQSYTHTYIQNKERRCASLGRVPSFVYVCACRERESAPRTRAREPEREREKERERDRDLYISISMRSETKLVGGREARTEIK